MRQESCRGQARWSYNVCRGGGGAEASYCVNTGACYPLTQKHTKERSVM